MPKPSYQIICTYICLYKRRYTFGDQRKSYSLLFLTIFPTTFDRNEIYFKRIDEIHVKLIKNCVSE